jgi:hypothetical protein
MAYRQIGRNSRYCAGEIEGGYSEIAPNIRRQFKYESSQGGRMADSPGARLEEPNATRQPAYTAQTRSGMVNGFGGRGDVVYTARGIGHNGRWKPSQENVTGNRVRIQSKQTQPRLGRNANGLPRALDFHRFPAPPGPQHDWEPPRTTTTREHRAARLKALGNAVVPQVVYPLAVMIREWLEAHEF